LEFSNVYWPGCIETLNLLSFSFLPIPSNFSLNYLTQSIVQTSWLANGTVSDEILKNFKSCLILKSTILSNVSKLFSTVSENFSSLKLDSLNDLFLYVGYKLQLIQGYPILMADAELVFTTSVNSLYKRFNPFYWIFFIFYF